jgi:hypothetical protein
MASHDVRTALDGHHGKLTMRSAARALLFVALGALTWTGVTAMAIAYFGRVLPPTGPLLLQRELLGFTSAFAVAGAIAGSISVAIYGRRRSAFGLGLALMAILAISVVSARWSIGRLTRLNGLWFKGVWSHARACIGFGVTLGGLTGIVTAGIAGIFAALTRRKFTWKIGLAVAALLAGTGFWALPQIIPQLLVQTIDYAHWHYGSAYDDAIRGAFVGAGSGGLAGSVIMILIAGDSARRRAPPV